jgi:antitoxin FitA
MLGIHSAYNGRVPLVQVRDVPESTLNALKARAAERGLTLTNYLRIELDRLASRPSNAEVVERLARRGRRGGPTLQDTVKEVRRIRAAS